MNAYSEVSESSGSEFDPGHESGSSEAPTVPAKRKSMQTMRKKTRVDAVPLRSTPKPFSFTENEDDDLTITPVLRRKRRLTQEMEAELSAQMAAIQATVDELVRKNAELSKTNAKQQQQIADLTKRVSVLERRDPQQTILTKTKVGNGVKQAVRVAVAECNLHKGLELDLDTDMNSGNNKALAEYCRNYAVTFVPDMTSEEFKAALKRYYDSQKERRSRNKRGKLQAHTDGQRKNQRKRRKSSNRVEGIEVSDLPHHAKAKYKPVLQQRDLVSTEESDVDEDGERVFTTKRRTWESTELTNAKRIADAAFCRKSGSASARIKRKRGLSEAPVPSLAEDQKWVLSTDYGMI